MQGPALACLVWDKNIKLDGGAAFLAFGLKTCFPPFHRITFISAYPLRQISTNQHKLKWKRTATIKSTSPIVQRVIIVLQKVGKRLLQKVDTFIYFSKHLKQEIVKLDS